MLQTVSIKPFGNLMKYLFLRYQVFGINNLNEFRVYIYGYHTALITNDISDEECIKFKNEFDEFVQDFYGIETTEGWVSIIENKGDKRNDAIKNFEILYLKFIKHSIEN